MKRVKELISVNYDIRDVAVIAQISVNNLRNKSKDLRSISLYVIFLEFLEQFSPIDCVAYLAILFIHKDLSKEGLSPGYFFKSVSVAKSRIFDGNHVLSTDSLDRIYSVKVSGKDLVKLKLVDSLKIVAFIDVGNGVIEVGFPGVYDMIFDGSKILSCGKNTTHEESYLSMDEPLQSGLGGQSVDLHASGCEKIADEKGICKIVFEKS